MKLNLLLLQILTHLEEDDTMSMFTTLIIFAMLATMVALISGISSMAHGGEFNRKHETQFMSARVGLQALTVLLLIIALIYS